MNPDIKIISRATDTKAERKPLIAGATNIIMPDYIGGIQMAHLITKPYVIEFLKTLSGLGSAHLHLEEFRSQDFKNGYRGKTLMDLNIRGECGALVLGFKPPAKQLVISRSLTIQFLINQCHKRLRSIEEHPLFNEASKFFELLVQPSLKVESGTCQHCIDHIAVITL